MGGVLKASSLLLVLGVILPRAALAQDNPAQDDPAQDDPGQGALGRMAPTLRWEAPPGCPAGAEVEREILRLLGAEGALAPGLPAVAARVDPHAEGAFSLELTVTQQGRSLGSRRLVGDSCESVAAAAALIAALAIDPGAVAREATRAAEPHGPDDRDRVGSPPGRSASTAAHALVEPPRRRRAGRAPRREPGPPAPDDRSTVFASASADTDGAFRIAPLLVVDLGTLPAPAVGPGLSVARRLGPVVLELRGVYLPSQRGRIDAHATAAGRLTLLAAGAGACLPLRDGRVEISPCVGLELGSMVGEGEGVSDPGRGAGLWAALPFGATATLEIVPWLHLRTELAGAVALHRPTFVLDDVGQVHRPSPVVGRASLGAEVRFP